jgi:hypothetical protein
MAGKNKVLKIVAAPMPVRKKSYHSMVVPIVLATTASIKERRETGTVGIGMNDLRQELEGRKFLFP